MPDEGFPAIWARALEALDVAGVTPQQRAFVRLTRPVGLLDGTALLAAPNDLTKEVLEQRMREKITELLSEQLGYPVRLAVTVDPTIAESPPPTPVAGIAMADIAQGAAPSTPTQAWSTADTVPEPSTPVADEVIDIRTYERPGAAGLVGGSAPLRHAGAAAPGTG